MVWSPQDLVSDRYCFPQRLEIRSPDVERESKMDKKQGRNSTWAGVVEMLKETRKLRIMEEHNRQQKRSQLQEQKIHQHREVDTLRNFIEKCCQCKGIYASSKVKEIQRHDRKKKFLPKPVGEWTQGTSKSFYRDELVSVWDKVKKACPSAPDLKSDM